jgi:hypothetical protein
MLALVALPPPGTGKRESLELLLVFFGYWAPILVRDLLSRLIEVGVPAGARLAQYRAAIAGGRVSAEGLLDLLAERHLSLCGIEGLALGDVRINHGVEVA